jgi:two-component system sensor histidine kinase AlgZ
MSIRQNLAALPLPDLRNQGVTLRLLVAAHALLALVALLLMPAGSGWDGWWATLLAGVPWLEPWLLGNGLLLWAAGPLLARLPLRGAQAFLLLQAAVLTWLVADSLRFLGVVEGSETLRAMLLGVAGIALLLGYCQLRAAALPPAVAEARLAALTTRIRPHFLFNSLNAVLGLIRSEPRRAEAVLENLAELLRALLRDNRELVPLSDEIALCRQYLEIEKLRLGERLQVQWELAEMPADPRLPPLMLQPLLENAIYHGIEPHPAPGPVVIRSWHEGKRLHLELSNPLPPKGAAAIHRGNRLALANIRERLALAYDLEATLESGPVAGTGVEPVYRVHIVLPLGDAA